MHFNFTTSLLFTLILPYFILLAAKNKKKDRLRTLTDAEIDALDDDWEDEDIKNNVLEKTDIPEWKRPKPEMNIEDMLLSAKETSGKGQDAMDESMLKKQKKYQTLMLFYQVIEPEFLEKNKIDLKKEEAESRKQKLNSAKNPHKHVSVGDRVGTDGKTYSSLSSYEFTDKISNQYDSQLYNNHLITDRYITDDDQVMLKLEDGSRAFEIRDFLVEQENCFKVVIEQKEYKGRGYDKRFDRDAEVKDELWYF